MTQSPLNSPEYDSLPVEWGDPWKNLHFHHVGVGVYAIVLNGAPIVERDMVRLKHWESLLKEMLEMMASSLLKGQSHFQASRTEFAIYLENNEVCLEGYLVGGEKNMTLFF